MIASILFFVFAGVLLVALLSLLVLELLLSECEFVLCAKQFG